MLNTDPSSAWTGLPTRRQLLSGAALSLAGLLWRSGSAQAADADGISHSAAAIHQQPAFTAGRERLYAALTDPAQFDQVVELSGVMQDMKLPQQPSVLSARVGAPFALFGGYITGRNLALVPNKLIVQAWRAGSWPAGNYSIAHFELREHDSGSVIVFDHLGFPQGEAQSLASGWREHYWEPLQTLLS